MWLYHRAWTYVDAQIVSPIDGDEESCEYVWISDCDYGGSIPKSVIDFASPGGMLQYVDSLRKLKV